MSYKNKISLLREALTSANQRINLAQRGGRHPLENSITSLIGSLYDNVNLIDTFIEAYKDDREMKNIINAISVKENKLDFSKDVFTKMVDSFYFYTGGEALGNIATSISATNQLQNDYAEIDPEKELPRRKKDKPEGLTINNELVTWDTLYSEDLEELQRIKSISTTAAKDIFEITLKIDSQASSYSSKLQRIMTGLSLMSTMEEIKAYEKSAATSDISDYKDLVALVKKYYDRLQVLTGEYLQVRSAYDDENEADFAEIRKDIPARPTIATVIDEYKEELNTELEFDTLSESINELHASIFGV